MSRKVKLFSSIPPTDEWRRLAQYTCASHDAYCKYWNERGHDYSYHLDVSDIQWHVRSPYIGDANQGYPASIRHSIKFRLFSHFLSPLNCREEYDYAVWIDADALITNFEIPLEKFFPDAPRETQNADGTFNDTGPHIGDLLYAYDINGVHPTVIMMRSTRLMRDLAWCGWNMGTTLYNRHDWDDIMIFKHYVTAPPYISAVWTHSAKVLCAIPPEIDYGHPKDGTDYRWDKDSLSLHLSALTMEKRIELAKSYCDRLGILK